jgi:adenine-specific DNA-methyltransferase
MPVLHWIGKEKVVRHHHEVPFKMLRQEYVHTAPEGSPANSTGNRIIHGDNLEALKALLPEFEGRVKCIYIDPPYNTGSEGWTYNDNVNEPHIQKWLHQVVGKEGEDLTRHDKWLCMMYPRLKLLHRLLADDGSIWVSLDDNESHYFKCLIDELFGRDNFVMDIIWKKRDGAPNDRKIGSIHEHIFIWAKSRRVGSKQTLAEEDFNLMPRTEKADSQYRVFKEPDGPDPRGPFRKIDTTANGKGGRYVESLFYPILNPYTKEEVWPRKGTCWRHNKEEMQKLQNDKRLYWGVTGSGSTPMRKLFKFEAKEGMTSPSIWDDVGFNQHASGELEKIFSEKAHFDTPKPSTLIERILQIATHSDSIILDSFAGSGTTAHAVLKLNAQDGGNRRFILIEMMEYAETITAERVRRVMGGYGAKSQPHPPPNLPLEGGGTEHLPPLQGEGRGGDGVKKNSLVAGLGGGFEYYTIGEALFDEDGNLNAAVPVEEIRRYVAYSEGIEIVGANRIRPPLTVPVGNFGGNSNMGACSAPLQKPHPSLLGTSPDAAYFFHYQPDSATTLDYEYLATLTFSDNKKPATLVIFADNCLLSAEQLKKHGIIFKKIPRDVTRF